MLKTCIESDAYMGGYDYEEGFKRLKEHGFDAIDYEGFFTDSEPFNKYSDEDYLEYIRKFKKAADDNGIEIFQVHGINPLKEFMTEYKEVDKLFERQLLTCKELGSKYLIIHPYTDGLAYFADSHETLMRKNKEVLMVILPVAKKYGVTICLENLPFRWVEMCRVTEIKKLIRDIDDENLKACLDTGHANVMKEDIYNSIKVFGDDLKTIHVHDNFGGADDRHYLPFRGNIDWDAFIKGLNEIGFKGYMNIETMISRKTPEPMLEQLQKGLYGIAKYLADRVK